MAAVLVTGWPVIRDRLYYGEFDSGSERTLAAWIRHASRTRFLDIAIYLGWKWRKGEERVGNLPLSLG